MNEEARFSTRRLAVAVAGLALVAAACSSGASASASAAASAEASAAASAEASAAASAAASAEASAEAGEAYEVTTANDPKLGAILAGEDGKTLYVFTKDSGSKSVCNADCAAAWPPFVLEADETVKGGGGVTGKFATIARDDGKMQVTYEGAPLYYYGGDTAAGQTSGQGVGGVWFVATPSGAAASPASSASGRYGTDY